MESKIILTEEIINMLYEFNINVDKIGLKVEMLQVLSNFHIEKLTSSHNIDIKKFIEMYVNDKKINGIMESTCERYIQRLSLFAKYVNKDIFHITINDIREYLWYLTNERKLSHITLSADIVVLRGFFKWLIEEEYIKKNPMTRIRTIKINKKNHRDPLTEEELEILRNSCRTTREKLIIELYYSTGCRVSELINITLDDIDFLERNIRIVGKGNKKRIVYFSVKAKLLLIEYIKSRKNKDSKYLFISIHKPYNNIDKRTIQMIISNIGKRSNINKVVCPHVLRHTFATNSLNSGMDITTVQRLLGHESLDTTQIYAKLSNDVVKYQYNKTM